MQRVRPPTAATVKLQAMAATPNAWLSQAELTGSESDVSFVDTVRIEIPKKPTTNVGSPLDYAEASGSVSLSLVHDADAEDEGFMIKAVAGGTGIVTDPAKSMTTTDPLCHRHRG